MKIDPVSTPRPAARAAPAPAAAAGPGEGWHDPSLHDPFGGATIDQSDHWPLPARAAIAIGGGAALWGLIALAFR